MEHMGQFALGCILLGLDFLAIAIWLSTWARDRSRASGAAIAVWFALILVFDLILLAAMVGLGAHPAGRWLPWVMLLNPADLFRVWGLASIGNVQALQPVSELFSLGGGAAALLVGGGAVGLDGCPSRVGDSPFSP